MAAAKVARLRAAGGDVVIVAPELDGRLEAAAATGEVRWESRRYVPEDLEDCWLAVAATSDPQVNGAVADAAAQRRLWCVRADGGGSADLLAGVRHGPFTIAVGTDGHSPALARRVREELEARYGPEYGELATLLGQLREDPAVRSALAALDSDARRVKWRSVLDADILELLRTGRTIAARELALACLSSSSD